MKNKKNILSVMVAALMLMMSACSPDDYSLGSTLTKADLKFSITQDPSDPNTVILESLTPNAIPCWKTPNGRSTKSTEKVQLAFPGEYEFIYSVMVNGGYVEADPFVLNLTTTNLNYVDHEYYTNLSGGVGKSKRWIVDNGKYGVASGAMAYGDPSAADNVAMGMNKYATNWAPEGNANGSSDADMHYGRVMEFSLQGGPVMKVYESDGSVMQTGTYGLDLTGAKLSTTDAFILRPDNYIANAANWNKDLQVVELTENRLCIAVMRTNSEGSWWYFWNYVSEEYAKSYVPADLPDPDFTFEMDQATALCPGYSQRWVPSKVTPFNWASLDGALMNSAWTEPSKYDSWTGFNEAAVANYAKVSLTFRSNGSFSFTDNDGVEQSGTYSLDAKKNMITFNGAAPKYTICGWVGAETTADHQWKILNIQMKYGKAYALRVGKRDPNKSEYMCFDLVVDESGFDQTAKQALTGDGTQMWKLDTNSPFDWGSLSGIRLNGFNAIGDYPGWTGYTADAIANFDKCRIVFSSDGTASFTNDAGEKQSGTFTLDATGDHVTFHNMDVNFTIAGWVSCATDKGRWNIFSTEYTNGKLEAIWFGNLSYNADGSKKEYMVYKFIKTKK